MVIMQIRESLGDQISNKISKWILVFVAAVVMVIFSASFFLSKQIFNKQVNSWNTIMPQQTLTNLIDSDYFSIKKEIEFLKSTELFSSFVITDNKKRVIANFGNDKFSDLNLIQIKDPAHIVWGYYYFKPDFYLFITPFLIAAAIFFICILIVYCVIRWRMRVSLDYEFSKFNDFLEEIEKITQRLPEIYNQEDSVKIDLKLAHNNEQIIIKKAIHRLLTSIEKSNKSLREAVSLAEQRRFQDELTNTALQMAHDIGSPVAVLEIIQSTALMLPEKDRVLIRTATAKIRDISNTLLSKAKRDFAVQEKNNLNQQMMIFLINQVLSEKRLQYGDRVNIIFQQEENAYQIFALVNMTDFNRVLSNVINNSVEAIEYDNRIIISLSDNGEKVLVQIKDHGKGIPVDVLNKLGKLGNTFGKSDGTGMGLYHAINTIESWGGGFDIQSQKDQGTKVQIFLPKCSAPPWFLSEIIVNDKQLIVIIDDENLIHAAWEKKFAKFKSSTNFTVEFLNFYSPLELINWKKSTENNENVLYLCDYEFVGHSINGIELIEKLQIEHQSILVTSGANNEVIARCNSKKIKLLPKDLVNIIPINEKIL